MSNMKKMNSMGEEEEELINTRLDLRLGVGGGDYAARRARMKTTVKEPSPASTVCLDLSFSLSQNIVKKENDQLDQVQDYTNNKISTTTCINNNNERKKLRLSREQSRLHEDTFKLHPTLNLAQKDALAKQLNVEPRQVEVWFQNRRTRTKLKQTEVDCEFLKKYCESLFDENRRLERTTRTKCSIS